MLVVGVRAAADRGAVVLAVCGGYQLLGSTYEMEDEELPGIGPVTAGHILAWRDEHGRFSVIEELMEVSGIGERTFAQLEPLVMVGG